jgi:azurin
MRMTLLQRTSTYTALTAFLLVGGVLLLGFQPSTTFAQQQDAPEAEADTVVTIRAVGSKLEYETTEVELEAGTTVTIRLDNSESTMPHNIVLLQSQEDIRTVGIAGLQAQATDYVPQSESDKIIAHTSLASPGRVVAFTFKVPPPGEYPYICTYPGHFQTMRGTLVSVETS